ncbi:MAG: class I SAM-dependent methyltransferase [Myxococcales bacterium]|nr:class I SAM-dependent methyltransferase [Myxococcales bacterium]
MSWDDEAATWDEGVFQRAYAEAAHRSLIALADRFGISLEGARICDFGCGTGLLTERLAARAARVDAVDTSPAMLAVLRAKAAQHGWGHVHLFPRLISATTPYDLVVCSSVCAFLEDYRGTVRQLVERMRPGGLFVQWDWELDPASEEPMGLSREAIHATLRSAGLAAVTVEIGFEATVEGHTMRPLVGAGLSPTP